MEHVFDEVYPVHIPKRIYENNIHVSIFIQTTDLICSLTTLGEQLLVREYLSLTAMKNPDEYMMVLIPATDDSPWIL